MKLLVTAKQSYNNEKFYFLKTIDSKRGGKKAILGMNKVQIKVELSQKNINHLKRNNSTETQISENKSLFIL